MLASVRDRPKPPPEPELDIPSTATIAVSFGSAVLGIVLGAVALAISEANDDLQQILAVAGIVAGFIAGVAAWAALARRRRTLSVLAVYGARDELKLAGELLKRYPKDIDRREDVRGLLERTSDSYRELVAAGAVEEAREFQAAHLDVQRALAKADAAGG